MRLTSEYYLGHIDANNRRLEYLREYSKQWRQSPVDKNKELVLKFFESNETGNSAKISDDTGISRETIRKVLRMMVEDKTLSSRMINRKQNGRNLTEKIYEVRSGRIVH